MFLEIYPNLNRKCQDAGKADLLRLISLPDVCFQYIEKCVASFPGGIYDMVALSQPELFSIILTAYRTSYKCSLLILFFVFLRCNVQSTTASC